MCLSIIFVRDLLVVRCSGLCGCIAQVWNTPIQWVSPMPDYKCFRAMPPTSNASASTVKWRVTDTLSVEQSSDGAPLPWLFWALGGLIAIGVIVAICVVWRSRKKKSKQSTKRSVETEEKGGEQGEQVGSGDERQPLVGTSMPNGSSMPSFAGSSLCHPLASFGFISFGTGHVALETNTRETKICNEIKDYNLYNTI